MVTLRSIAGFPTPSHLCFPLLLCCDSQQKEANNRTPFWGQIQLKASLRFEIECRSYVGLWSYISCGLKVSEETGRLLSLSPSLSSQGVTAFKLSSMLIVLLLEFKIIAFEITRKESKKYTDELQFALAL